MKNFTDAPTPILNLIRNSGKSLILRGFIMLLFGIMLCINPVKTSQILMIVLGAFLIIDAITLLGFSTRISGDYWAKMPFIIPGFIMLAFGFICIFSGAAVLATITVLIGIWLLITGIQQLTAVRTMGIWAILSAVLTLLIGVILVTSPWTSLSNIVWLIGVLVIISAISSLSLGFKMRFFR